MPGGQSDIRIDCRALGKEFAAQNGSGASGDVVVAVKDVEFGFEIQGVPAKQRFDRAMDLLNKCRLTRFEEHYPHQLSGGMRQYAAPAFLPAFGPWMLAQAMGYYKAEGLNVKFQRARGGVDVGKQVGAGNTALVFVTIIMLTVVGIIAYGGVVLLEKKALHYLPRKDYATI